MIPSDKYREFQRSELLREERVRALRSLDKLVLRLKELVASNNYSPIVQKVFECMLKRTLERRSVLRDKWGPTYDWIILKGVVRGMPLFWTQCPGNQSDE